ncbi:hypothetical protein HMPREF1221_01553 [Treponema socranskii subsp. paredis ATCC 35535]|nr:hypothetical protein HMPREF1221_01553 [Treponema socranskii subsp. paredis ATCC 35535]
MKPDYKNWVPKEMLALFSACAGISLILFIVFGIAGIGVSGTLKIVLSVLFALAFAVFGTAAVLFLRWYRAFDYNGKRQMSRGIIEGTAKYVTLPSGGRGLDVGCGSGALTIACAKRNPQGAMIGVDPWGAEYRSFSKALCENNAKAEGVSNVCFEKGNAVKLDFPDESFDAVTSNYVYHNITGVNKQELLSETLRVLKKGGVFAIHDLMSRSRYGDMDAFVADLKAKGYEKAELIDTTQGLFMTPKEAKSLQLTGSTLLIGKK